MDYDATRIPERYDSARSYPPHVLQLWLSKVASYAGTGRVDAIVDIGCGTGRYSAALALQFGAEVVGVEPSRRMLDQARSKAPPAGVRYELGSAEKLPLADASVDLAFASMIFHHLGDPGCRRNACLEPSGC